MCPFFTHEPLFNSRAPQKNWNENFRNLPNGLKIGTTSTFEPVDLGTKCSCSDPFMMTFGYRVRLQGWGSSFNLSICLGPKLNSVQKCRLSTLPDPVHCRLYSVEGPKVNIPKVRKSTGQILVSKLWLLHIWSHDQNQLSLVIKWESRIICRVTWQGALIRIVSTNLFGAHQVYSTDLIITRMIEQNKMDQSRIT